MLNYRTVPLVKMISNFGQTHAQAVKIWLNRKGKGKQAAKRGWPGQTGRSPRIFQEFRNVATLQ